MSDMLKALAYSTVACVILYPLFYGVSHLNFGEFTETAHWFYWGACGFAGATIARGVLE